MKICVIQLSPSMLLALSDLPKTPSEIEDIEGIFRAWVMIGLGIFF